jgi:predicted alpha/beta superfamily hydrolase
MPRPADPDGGRLPFSLPRSEVRIIHTGQGEYRLMTAWPAEPPPPGGFPVVYLLDANAVFGTMVEGIRIRARRADATGVVPAIVVGVDYPLDEREPTARRIYDCTPSPEASPHAPGRAGLAPGASGGAERFLATLLERVMPAIARSFPVDPSRQVLAGHSLTGLFVLQALLTAPRPFETCVAISPSIWWDRERLLELATRGGSLAAARVFIGVGEYEQSLAPWQRPRAGESSSSIAARRRERRMEDDARGLAEALSTVAAEVVFERFADADHASAWGVGIQRCLRFCLSPRDPRRS